MIVRPESGDGTRPNLKPRGGKFQKDWLAGHHYRSTSLFANLYTKIHDERTKINLLLFLFFVLIDSDLCLSLFRSLYYI